MTEAALYLPIGPPGAGKSTLARLMVAAGIIEEDAIVSPDYFRKQLTGRVGDQTENYSVFSICNRIAAARIQRKLPVYFDSTNIRAEWRTEMVATARSGDVPIYSIVFDVGPEECRIRNANYDREETGARVPGEVMDLMIDLFGEITEESLPGTIVRSKDLEASLQAAISVRRKHVPSMC